VLSAAVLALERTLMNEPIFDHEKLDVYRLSIDYVAFSYALSSALAGNNRHAREKKRKRKKEKKKGHAMQLKRFHRFGESDETRG
jgi:hypothetical protein